jgi:predicted amidohydrolase YtcJ
MGPPATAADLDSAVGNRPAALSSHDGHALWLNSAGLRATGVDRSTSAPPGGVIERDAHSEPSGVLFENAQDLVRRGIPEPTDEQVRDAIRQALPIAAAAGLTGIHNLEDSRSRRAFQSLEAAGEVTLRVYHGVPRCPNQKLSLSEAVHAYTAAPAAERALPRRGALSAGKDADLVVLSPNPFALDPAALLHTQVALTMVGGRIVFKAAL